MKDFVQCGYCKARRETFVKHECKSCGHEFFCNSSLGCSPNLLGGPACANCALKNGLLRKPSHIGDEKPQGVLF